jgi:flagellar protein FliO/FliZ
MANEKYFLALLALNKPVIHPLFSVIKFFILLLIFFAVLFLAYYTTKLISKKSAYLMKNKNIRIIERAPLTIDKSIVIVNIGEIYYLIGVGKQSMELLDKIHKEDIEIILDDMNDQHEVPSNKFKFYLENFLNKYKNTSNHCFSKKNDINDILDVKRVSLHNKLKEIKERTKKIKYHTDEDENK